jgi:hypothetical protein
VEHVRAGDRRSSCDAERGIILTKTGTSSRRGR